MPEVKHLDLWTAFRSPTTKPQNFAHHWSNWWNKGEQQCLVTPPHNKSVHGNCWGNRIVWNASEMIITDVSPLLLCYWFIIDPFLWFELRFLFFCLLFLPVSEMNVGCVGQNSLVFSAVHLVLSSFRSNI